MNQRVKKIVYISIIIVSIALIVQSLFKLNDKFSEEAKTSISIHERLIDIGDVKLNQPTEIIFLMVNTGKEDLKIYDVRPDCQCTVADWDKIPIPPNQATQIKAKYSANTTGHFQKNIVVGVNSDDSPIVLTFRGRGVSD